MLVGLWECFSDKGGGPAGGVQDSFNSITILLLGSATLVVSLSESYRPVVTGVWYST